MTKYRKARKQFKLVQLERSMLQPYQAKDYVVGSGHQPLYKPGKEREYVLKLLPEEAIIHKTVTIVEHYCSKLKLKPEELTYKHLLKLF
jgi:hypothetical protein